VFARLKERKIAERRERENEKRKEIGQQLQKAVSQSPPSLDKIQTLVEACRGVLAVVGVNGNLPLHYVCSHGAPMEVARYLVQSTPSLSR
jgi:hypothetical protein